MISEFLGWPQSRVSYSLERLKMIIRTQRILGQLIQEGQRRGEIAKPAENQANLVTDGNRVKKTLSDIGISRKESA